MSAQNDDAKPPIGPVRFAPVPVSTELISGSMAVRSYREDWVGDDSDILSPDRVHGFTSIDMTAWTVAFLRAVDALFVPGVALAIAALDPDRAASLAGHKQRLADVIAETLRPVLDVPGEVPAIDDARALFRESLLEGLGEAYAPRAGDRPPLRLCPPPPLVSGPRAATAQSPVSIAEALLWDCIVTVSTPQAAPDELLMSILINDQPVPGAVPPAMAVAPRESAAATLFEALGRMTVEYPQIAPHLAAVQAGGDAAVARAALDRLDALIGDVVLTWPGWFARALPSEATAAGSSSAGDGAIWRYTLDFGGRPVLGVTRCPVGDSVPPWPVIAGFVTPPENGQAADSYQPSADSPAEAPLTFTWAGLPIHWAQQVDVAASVRRNANLVPSGSPEGTLIDPAFICTAPVVQGRAPVRPLADLPSQPLTTGKDPATLSKAVDDVLTPLLAGPVLAGLAIRDLQIELDASYGVSQDIDGTSIDSFVPIFPVRNILALSADAPADAVPVAEFRQEVIDALIAWHADVRPDDANAMIRFAITLSPTGVEGAVPLVRFGQVQIAIPAAQETWWQ